MIPFSPPKITQEVIDEVVDALRSGWITTGPKIKQLEKEVAAYAGAPYALCLNSATAGLELMLRWFGVKEGDEVILPAYTYCATANVVLHCGAKPVLVDVRRADFNMDAEQVRKAITPRTKVIMPVDIGGMPCDYPALQALLQEPEIRSRFVAETPEQQQLGRVLLLADAAHSFGASAGGKRAGSLCDASVFSFHAVKNFTTAEGGAVCLCLPEPFHNQQIYQALCVKSLHGQNKDALAKTQKGNWEYDIVEAGYKWNMPDVLAAIGLAEIRHYNNETLLRRKKIMEAYSQGFRAYAWAELPVFDAPGIHSSCHLYMLRIRHCSESQRNAIIQKIFDQDVSVNVHFKPLPLLSLYKNLGYRMEDYPVAFDSYAREISLPVYYDLSEEQVQTVIRAVVNAVASVLK